MLLLITSVGEVLVVWCLTELIPDTAALPLNAPSMSATASTGLPDVVGEATGWPSWAPPPADTCGSDLGGIAAACGLEKAAIA
jgi:hypothetical protein